MDVKTLEKGVDLQRKINQCADVLNCFTWRYEDVRSTEISTNPTIIIEFDGCDGREEAEVPFDLNAEIIEAIKAWTSQRRDLAIAEFKDLQPC